jgi:glycosyltransferase involved in cell wall biosynthesis
MPQDQPLFSIIVPTYNRPRQLADCLRALSVLDYPRHRFEVMVVDDGGDCPLEEVVASFRPRLRVTLITRHNGGPGAARNTGAARARGRFLAFTDDDCLPSRQWLGAMAACFASGPWQAIAGRTVNALNRNPFASASQFIVDMVHAYYNTDPHQARFSASNNLALPTRMFLVLGGFDESFRTSEDRDLIDRWRHHGHGLIFAPEVLVYHAHRLDWGGYCRQHFGYGRGAFRYHQARARRGCGTFKPELAFLWHVLRSWPRGLDRDQEKGALSLALLLGVWQLANTAGFIWEGCKEGWARGWPGPRDKRNIPAPFKQERINPPFLKRGKGDYSIP